MLVWLKENFMAVMYQSKANLNKVLKTPDLFLVIEAAGLDENSQFFEQELKFGILVDETKYNKIPDNLKKHFKKVSE